MPNQVNYEIKSSKGKVSIIHHNRLKKYPTDSIERKTRKAAENNTPKRNKIEVTPDEKYFDLNSDESSSDSDVKPDDGVPTNSDSETEEIVPLRRSARSRQQRVIEGSVPWEVVDDLLRE